MEQFNRRLIEWANEHESSLERISFENANGEYSVPLTAAEQAFVQYTYRFSNEENREMVISEHSKTPEEDPIYNEIYPVREVENNIFCDFWYQFSYHITDKRKITVEKRDQCISGMINEINKYYTECSDDDLLTKKKSDFVSYIISVAKKYSNKKINISIDRN